METLCMVSKLCGKTGQKDAERFGGGHAEGRCVKGRRATTNSWLVVARRCDVGLVTSGQRSAGNQSHYTVCR